tara:strand:- start:194696 stop:194974 length:279 start_codon:yes stop_codon:yes gene_type:complete
MFNIIQPHFNIVNNNINKIEFLLKLILISIRQDEPFLNQIQMKSFPHQRVGLNQIRAERSKQEINSVAFRQETARLLSNPFWTEVGKSISSL